VTQELMQLLCLGCLAQTWQTRFPKMRLIPQWFFLLLLFLEGNLDT
jgi:hypothetical protein